MSSPFNEEKYKALLEGLEIAIVKFSELSKVIDYRIEAEYFAHKFLEIDKAISKTKTISFTEVATFINGRPYGSDCFNCNEGVRISKIGDVTNRREISEWVCRSMNPGTRARFSASMELHEQEIGDEETSTIMPFSTSTFP